MVYCLNPHCPHPDAAAEEPKTAGALAAKFCPSCGTSLTLIDEAQGPRYQLVSRIGQGGFGRTFLAERLPTDENRATIPCIIKQIYDNSLAGEAGFHAEAERLRKLGEHPQIPALLGAVENALGQFLVQAYAPGNTLAEQVALEGTWTETQVRSLLKSLVPVLQYVHSFDIIHRDIKPANIVLATDKNLLPMLVDFGSAKWVRQSPAKTVIGSASYAAPEQSLGQATFASDIYSLGLTCLHALTGIHPFALFSAAENRWVWRDYLPQPIEPRFAQLLDQMVAPSLQQRYESMDQVSLDFQFSRNPLLHAPRQLFTRAKKSVAPLTNALQGHVADKALPAASVAIVTTPQHWQRRHRITQPIGLTKAIALSPRHQPSGPIFATAGIDGAVRLWHLPSGQLIHTFHRRRLMGNGHTAAVTALRFHPDGRALYSASADGTIKEWDSAERCLLNTLTTAGWTPTALTVTPDGAQLVSPYSDGQIVLWDITTLRPVAQLTQHQKSVNAVDISSRGNLLASASADGTIKLWQYPRAPQGKGRPLLAKTISLNLPQSARNVFGGQGPGGKEVIALALHTPPERPPSGPATLQMPYLVTATTDGLIQRYALDEQLNPGKPTVVYQAPMPVTAFALSADGTLAVGTDDTLLTLWDIYTGECVAKLPHDWGLVAIAFSADSQTLITASADEVISIWQRAAAS